MKSIMLKQGTDSEYPALKQYPNDDGIIIVLFISESCGTVVYNDTNLSGNRVGHYSQGWAPNVFHRFNGQILLGDD